MPARTRSRSNSKSVAVNGGADSPGKDEPTKTPTRRRSTSRSRRSTERSKSRERSSSPEKKKKSVVRQKTPPRPHTPVETPVRMSRRLQERREKEEEVEEKEEEQPKWTPVPRTRQFAFGGPLGSLGLMLFLPLITHLLNFVCLGERGRRLLVPASWFSGLRLADCWDATTALLLAGWLLAQALIAALPLGGRRVLGLPLHHEGGRRLAYNCNGLFALCLTLAAVGAAVAVDLARFGGRLAWLTYVVDHLFQLMVAATAFSLLLSLLLYLKALRAPEHALAPEGNSGCWPYDFFMGHELNPRLGEFDLKFFFEFRPGLIGWVLLDVAFCAKYWQMHAGLSLAMLLVTGFHLLYVADALYFEESILSTMDIIHEGFGFMLVFGDVVWVPFTYTLTAHYLLTAPPATGLCLVVELVAAALLCLVGYWIFRGANSQKDQFRRDPRHPSVAALDSIPTSSGRRLLAGGWWGLVRHPNYLGDIVMSVAWSTPCGFRAALPWFYPVYLTALLVGREMRDEEACLRKHGHGWRKYQELVPFRIFPRVF